MAQLFNNKYRISSVRLKNWNYTNEAMYFVTICTKNRENYFGEIFNPGDHTIPKIKPTIIGEIAHSEWYKSIELRPDMNLELGEFVVMPNHIHGIIIIGANEINKPKGVDTIMENDRDAMHCVSIIPTTNNINTDDTKYKNHFAPQSKNLSSIIRGYKSAVTTFAKKNNIEFEWQSRFHDHIIRSMDDYHRISKYILNNPSKWLNDKFYQ